MMHCYKVTVAVTNGSRRMFKTRGTYADCEDGVVYVLAKDAADAAAMIPEAQGIFRVGVAFARQSAPASDF
jgi:hypothetical protein